MLLRPRSCGHPAEAAHQHRDADKYPGDARREIDRAVQARLVEGAPTVRRDVEWPRDQPPMGRPEIEKKFRELAGTGLNEKRRDEVLKAIDGLDTFDNVADFAQLLV